MATRQEERKMLLSIAAVLLVGLSGGWICKRLHLPALLGMLAAGIVLGPYMWDVIDGSVLAISADIRRIALIIILTRAGLSLDLNDLKRVGRPAVLMCFVPACFEILGMIWLAPRLFDVTIVEAAIMGAVIAAVSPAVIVPKMLKLMEEGYGMKKGIPQLILAGASVDDVFVIVMFSVFLGLEAGDGFSAGSVMKLPVSIVLGVLAGGLIGKGMTVYVRRVKVRDTIKVVLLLSLSFILVTLEDLYGDTIPFSGLIAVMIIGMVMQQDNRVTAGRLAAKFNKLWVVAEVFLFVLVGATVNIKFALAAGPAAVILLAGVLLFRMAGVLVCLIRTELTLHERLFCMLAYLPKATVQAAIGGIPLAMGLGCGNLVLTVAVLSIIITAPVGSFLIEISYRRLLQTGNETGQF